MKPLHFICILILFAACQKPVPLEISGKSNLPDGTIISISGDRDSTLATTFVSKGQFELKKFGLDSGYYTLTTKNGDARQDFDVYLAPGKYLITLPDSANKYLTAKTKSTTQNKLTDYYNLEDSVLYKFRRQVKKTTEEIGDPKNAKLSEAQFQELINSQNAAKARVNGALIAAMNMYIDRHPKADVILHVISNMDYSADPSTYQMVFNRLSNQVKNSEEGKGLKAKLTQAAQPKAVSLRN